MLIVNQIVCSDAFAYLKSLPDECVNMVFTSPPYYGLRDYNVDGQLGHELTIESFIENLGDLFAEARRVLRKDGTLWINMGDCYATKRNGRAAAIHNRIGHGPTMVDKPFDTISESRPNKCLIGQPYLLAFELIKRGWLWRSNMVWHKPNAKPESVDDRFSVDFEQY